MPVRDWAMRAVVVRVLVTELNELIIHIVGRQAAFPFQEKTTITNHVAITH